jgi:hypothetical protein
MEACIECRFDEIPRSGSGKCFHPKFGDLGKDHEMHPAYSIQKWCPLRKGEDDGCDRQHRRKDFGT